jgi:hypothetical protein
MRSIQTAFFVVLALNLGVPVAAQVPTRAPETYGTSAVSYIEVPASNFLPGTSAQTYASDDAGTGPRWGSNNGGIGVGFTAGVQLPEGAKPVYLEIDFIDTNPTKSVFASFVECDIFSVNCTSHPNVGAGPADCSVAGYICSGHAFSTGIGVESADLAPDSITIDNFNKSYRLYAATFADDASLKIGGMIVGYVLQVSPAPVTASFNDVPTSHPFFQYIEALKASGITGGCQANPPLYCPDAALTRGQMAVFLAKALGLQWH